MREVVEKVLFLNDSAIKVLILMAIGHCHLEKIYLWF